MGEGSGPVLQVEESFPLSLSQTASSWPGSAQCLSRRKRAPTDPSAGPKHGSTASPAVRAQANPSGLGANNRSALSLGTCCPVSGRQNPQVPSARCYRSSSCCLCCSGFGIPVGAETPHSQGDGALRQQRPVLSATALLWPLLSSAPLLWPVSARRLLLRDGLCPIRYTSPGFSS